MEIDFQAKKTQHGEKKPKTIASNGSNSTTTNESNTITNDSSFTTNESSLTTLESNLTEQIDETIEVFIGYLNKIPNEFNVYFYITFSRFPKQMSVILPQMISLYWAK